MSNYYIKTIEHTPVKPTSCITCGREGLKDGIAIIQTGPNNNSLTPKENILCLYCETLMIITTEPRASMTLKAANGEDKVTLVHAGGR